MLTTLTVIAIIQGAAADDPGRQIVLQADFKTPAYCTLGQEAATGHDGLFYVDKKGERHPLKVKSATCSRTKEPKAQN